MPIFEYYSPATNKVYSFFVRGSLPPGALPRCPDGDQHPMRKLVSGFAVVGRAREMAEEGGDPDDPRMEAAMAELEREMAGMDEENPDPRQMGHLMRRMSELTGEKMPGVMEEMVGRLEAGEDPEKLEAEYGDLADLEEFDSGEDTPPDGRTSFLRRLRGPVKDPELYEMSDYV
ncbi:MAG: cytochrome C [Opitutales bacterium]|jgi:hypothetical protein